MTFGYLKMKRGAGSEMKQDSVLVMQLKGAVPLVGSQGIGALLDGGASTSVDTLRRAFEKAARDEKIIRVALVLDQLSMGFGGVESLREIMQSFRKSGKSIDVLIESDNAGEAELYLGAAASRVLLTPHTMVTFDGLAADITFYGETMEKLGIQPEVIQFKEYKSAFEPFTGKQMSAPMKASIDAMLASTWNNVVQGIAKDRKVSVQKLQAFADKGMGTAKAAIDLGVVDAVGYFDDLVKEAPEQRVAVASYLKSELSSGLSELASTSATSPAIALIPATGNIVVDAGSSMMPGNMLGGRSLAAKVRKAANDDKISAILLWVNSPGGSMVGSDLVWREVQRAREVHKKPVIVSMGSVAASGGYWISMGADAIVAAPSTITGSIGVIFGRFSMKEFLSKLGLSHDLVIKGGKNANLGSVWEPLTSEQRSNLEALLGEGYAQFVKKVAQGRGRTEQEIDAVAKGRVWTGQDALTHGLVDRLGGILTAVELCKEKLGLTQDAQVDLRIYPRQSLWEQLSGGGAGLLDLGILQRDAPAKVVEKLDQELHRTASPQAWVRAPNLRVR